MRQSTPPDISVMMTVWNQDHGFLVSAIESILRQTEKNFEFLILSDGTSPENLTIIDRYRTQDKRIVCIKMPHIGLTKCLNYAISKARGHYIARMDSDDVAFPQRLARQKQQILTRQIDLTGANCELIDEGGRKIGELNRAEPLNIKRHLFRRNFFTHSTLFGTKKIFSELYNESFPTGQDYEFLLRTISKGYKIGYDSAILGQFRVNSQGISYRRAKEQEWSGIRSKWLALNKYNYNPLYTVYLVESFLRFLIPSRIKRYISRQLLRI